MGHKVVLAVCSLNQWAMDFDGNLKRIITSVQRAKQLGAKYRLGPELEITGYGCNDHFLESDTFLHSWEVLSHVITHPECQDILIDIGMPVMHKNVAYNCRVFLLNQEVILIRPKLSLCDHGNYREGRWFTGWSERRKVEKHILPSIIRSIKGQETVPFGDAIVSTRDTCLGSEICEELWTADSHHIDMGLDGVEIFANGSGSHHELRKGYVRSDLLASATMKGGGVYCFANMLGCDGERVYYDGRSCIYLNGEPVVQGAQFSLSEELPESRCAMASKTSSFERILVDFSLGDYSNVVPVVLDHHQYKLLSAEEEISLGPALWLWDYLRRSGLSGFLLPLSGGVDSSSVACIVYCMCCHVFDAFHSGVESVVLDLRRIVADDTYVPKSPNDICNHILTTIYMATSNSSELTTSLARDLAAQIGSYHMEICIDPAVNAVVTIFQCVTKTMPRFRANGGTYRENLALQNIQARLRWCWLSVCPAYSLVTWKVQVVVWVLGSANVDESLRGYMTKYDCSSADLNPIGGISKADLRSFIQYCINKYDLPILNDIVKSPPTAELEPLIDGQIAQTDEDDMGMSYEELSVFGKLRKNVLCGPYSMFCKLTAQWKEKFSPFEIAGKVKHFFRSYAINRHKMTTLTPAYHAEQYSPDDNRYDLRQFLYNVNWPWQFRRLNEAAEKLQEVYERRQIPEEMDPKIKKSN